SRARGLPSPTFLPSAELVEVPSADRNETRSFRESRLTRDRFTSQPARTAPRAPMVRAASRRVTPCESRRGSPLSAGLLDRWLYGLPTETHPAHSSQPTTQLPSAS